jgi:hypothetical protein
MLAICIDSGVFELLFGSLLSCREFTLKYRRWRRWKSSESFGSCDVTNCGGSCRSLSFWSDVGLGRRSRRNWTLCFLDNRLCHNWSWWGNSYWLFWWSSYRLSLDFSYWARDLRLDSWLANLLDKRGFLFNRFHELGKRWWLLFDDREFTLLNCSDRLRKCRRLWRSWDCFRFLSNDSRLFLLCLDSH